MTSTLTKKQRNDLVVKNQKLAMMVAHRMRHCTIEPYEDLAQIALIGLMRAIDKFDESRGYALSSFAVPFIRGEILHWVRDRGTQIKVPRRWRENYSAGCKFASSFVSSGITPTDDVIAAELGITPAEWREQKQACEARTVAFPEHWEAVDPSNPPEEDNTEAEPIMLAEYRLQLRDAVQRLPRKHKDIIEYAYSGQPLGAYQKLLSAQEATEKLQEALQVLRSIVKGEVHYDIEEQLSFF